MEPLEVLVYPHPALRRGGQTVTAFDQDLRALAAKMMESMYDEIGCGLAAPQVGIEQKLLVLNPSGDKSKREEELALVNPRILKKKGREWDDEGCLSFPGIRAEVERHVDITVVYQDLDGKEQSLKASGFLARVIQHEMDHLEGVLMVDRLSAGDKLRVRPRLEELEQRYARS